MQNLPSHADLLFGRIRTSGSRRRVLSILGRVLVFVALLVCSASTFGAPRIAVIQTQDPNTRSLGLSEFLRSERITFTDITGVLRDGGLPDVANVDLLIVGSFLTSEAQLRTAYQQAGAKLRQFVADGGMLVVLSQTDQDQEIEDWMEKPRRIKRSDLDAAAAFITTKDHPLLKQPEQISAADLRGWRVPANFHSPNTVWESFNEWSEGSVILATDESPNPAKAAMIEMGWGAGRAVFLAMAPDKAFVIGNDAARKGATKLLRNLIAYAPLVRSGAAPTIQITQTPGYKHPIRGVVYLDQNGNGKRDEAERGLSGIAMSDGFEVALTDDSGAYQLPNNDRSALFVFVHQSDKVKQSGQKFFHRLPNDAATELHFDFGLEPAPARTSPSGVRFVQLTDSHIRDVNDRDYMKQATAEIYAMNPPPDFVVATGDLVDWCVDEHYQNYVAGMQQPPVPYFNVFGNHEIVFGPIDRYHQYIGPDYFSFERAGILFLVLNCVTPGERQDAWLKRTVELMGKGRAMVVFQHYPPTLEQLEQFGKMGVKSVFSGHWHSEKEMKHATVQSINSPTFIMGGIDASPAGFKVVEMSADGFANTEWRYGFQKKRLTIVSPQKGSPVSSSYFPIIINAYDSSQDVASVHWWLESENKPTVTQEKAVFGRRSQKQNVAPTNIIAGSGNLRRDSAISWSGAHTNLPQGTYELRVEVQDTLGETWTASQQVETHPGGPAKPAPRGDWPMFMGNSSRTGFNPESIDSLPLRLAWSVDTGGDPDFASPILADGRIYLGLKKRTGGRTNGVAAFDPVTGERLWFFETPMAINHTPAYAQGTLCVAEMGGRIYGLNATNGQERWHHDLMDEKGRYSYCAPVAHGDWFYAGVMRRLARLRTGDGHLSWEKQIGGANNDWISSYGSPAVKENYIAMAGLFSQGDSLVVSRVNDGSKVWGHVADGGMLASPTIAGDRVLFCTTKSILYCQRLSDGTNFWRKNLGATSGDTANWSATTPAVKLFAEGAGVVVAGSGDGHMSGIDLDDGRVLWTHVSASTIFKVSPYRRDDRPLLSSPTIAGNEVFFGSADGNIYCLDLTTGKKLWSFEIGSSVMSTPLVAGNAVYVAANDGRLYAFTGGTGGVGNQPLPLATP